MSRLTLALALLISALTSLPTTAPALMKQVSFDPVSPTPQDILEVTVIGEFPDGCWNFDRIESQIEPDVVTVHVYVVDHFEERESCPAVVIPYTESVVVGVLDAGSYLLRVVEYRDSTRVPPTQTIEASLQVSVPNLSTSWSTMKARYAH